jgi:aldehyde:ferredoxin oxidoreductase
MLGGYVGKVLSVDLTTSRITEEEPSEKVLRDFLGGYGLGVRIIYDRMIKGTNPLSKDSIFGIVAGPLTGTPVPTGTRFTVVGRSPLTGTWGDANCGGRFGPELKFAGYDAVFFAGISPEPVYLMIDEGNADLRKASFIWGKDVVETDESLKQIHGKRYQVLTIGPAGERRIPISSVMNEKGRAAGRSGLGAIMGSKRLKAVVAKGSRKVPLSDEGQVMNIREQCINEIIHGTGFADFYRKTGTPGYVTAGVMNGDSPVRNWGGVGYRDFPNYEAVGYDAGLKYQTRRYGCWQCPIACGYFMSVKTGPYTVAEGHRPEYETTCAFGTNCGNANIESVIRANEICNRYGMDTINTGALVAFAIECYENGLLTVEDTDGLELKWGNHQAIVALTEMIAKGEGLGDILSQGLEKAAQEIGKGAEAYAFHVRGEALPMHDPRYEPSLGLIYSLNATPAHHTQASQFLPPPGLDLKIPSWNDHEAPRGEQIKVLECLMHVVNSVGLCLFGYLSTSTTHLPEFVSAVTGWTLTMDDLLEIGERIANMRQAFNAREELNPLQFRLPQRAMGMPPLDDGPTAGRTANLEKLRTEYLQAMDWSLDSAKPSKKKLTSLGLDDIASDLYITA